MISQVIARSHFKERNLRNPQASSRYQSTITVGQFFFLRNQSRRLDKLFVPVPRRVHQIISSGVKQNSRINRPFKMVEV